MTCSLATSDSALNRPSPGDRVWPISPSQLVNDAPLFARLGMFMLLLMVPTGFAALIDDRLLYGVNVWVKPLKFELALAVYLLTLAFFARYAPALPRRKLSYRVFEHVVATAIVAEMIWIGGAAAFGIASHFNTSEPFMAAIYGLMGMAAVILTSASMVQAWHIHGNAATGLSPAVKSGIVAGLALTLPLTLVTAGYMSSAGGHGVGGTGVDAGGLPLMGWLRDGGDLRVAHFFATHSLHVIPAFAIASAALFGPGRVMPVRAFAAAFALFVLIVFAQALIGQPFLASLGA